MRVKPMLKRSILFLFLVKNDYFRHGDLGFIIYIYSGATLKISLPI